MTTTTTTTSLGDASTHRFYNRGTLAILLWYSVNITTVILNKWLYTVHQFRFPFALTLCHMGACSVLGFVVLRVLKLMPMVHIEWHDRLWRVLPMSVVFIVNIILGNVALAYVPVSFMQTVKSSVPFFTYVIQVMFVGKAFDARVAAALVPVVTGVALATWTEVNFDMTGFVCALVASVVTAVQSIVGAYLLSGNLKMDSVNLIYNMAPSSFLLLLPAYLYKEHAAVMASNELFTDQLLVLLIVSSVVAFFLNFAVFFAIKATSALSFTVAGNFKVVVVILVSVAIFRNEITWLNGVGICVTIVGCWLYNTLQWQIRQAALAVPSTKR